jgi:hypothetical protein
MDRTDPVVDAPLAWHICWQAAVGRDLFAEASLHARVRARLLDAHARRGRILLDYLLLPGEIHVLARLQPGDSAGDLARSIGNVVARWVRATQSVRSPVFAGPYRAHAIATPDALRHELRLLAWRPVVLGLCSTPSHYAHSALRTTLGLRPAQGFDARPLLQLFGEAVSPARASLRAWLRGRPSERQTYQWALTCGLVLATGTVGPHVAVARELRQPEAASLVAAAGPGGIDAALALLELWVKARLGAPPGLDLHVARDAVAARGRALVASLALAHRLCSAASVARYFKRAKATLSEQMAACRRRPADRLILAVPVQRIVEEALALRSHTALSMSQHGGVGTVTKT